MHANSSGERGTWLCINLIVGKDFTSWIQSIHQLLTLYRQQKFGGGPLFPPWFPGNVMLKLVREEEVLRCEKCQSKLPFIFNYFWCNTFIQQLFLLFSTQWFWISGLHIPGVLGQLGVPERYLRKAGLLLVHLSLLSKGLLYSGKIFWART